MRQAWEASGPPPQAEGSGANYNTPLFPSCLQETNHGCGTGSQGDGRPAAEAGGCAGEAEQGDRVPAPEADGDRADRGQDAHEAPERVDPARTVRF